MTGRGESPTSPRRIDSAHRDAAALDMRRAGHSYAHIAAELGYADRGHAHRQVSKALDAVRSEPAEALRDMELARLDEMHAAVWDQARDGDLHALDRILRIMERRARLLGLDYSMRPHDRDAQTAEAVDEAVTIVLDMLDATPAQAAAARDALTHRLDTRPGFPRPEERERRHHELLAKAGYGRDKPKAMEGDDFGEGHGRPPNEGHDSRQFRRRP